MCGVGIAQCPFNLCTTGQSNMKCQIFKLVWEPVTGVYLDNSHIMVIDRCQKKVSADQCRMTLSRAQGPTHRGRVFFGV